MNPNRNVTGHNKNLFYRFTLLLGHDEDAPGMFAGWRLHQHANATQHRARQPGVP